MNQQTKTSLAESVWQNLYSINVSKNIEKKGNLSYLSWTWAWQALMEEYPQATYRLDDRTYPDGSMEVYVWVTIERHGEKIERMMWLSVMDHKNKPIQNPNSAQIANARMRCLVKCIAMHGLGIYIYAGEDIPKAEQEALSRPITDDQVEALAELIKATATDIDKFLSFYEIGHLEELKGNMFEQAYAMLRRKLEEAERSAAQEEAIPDESL
jgi:hypothetical protein